MKRPRQHVMEDASEQVLRSALPAEWIIRPIVKDYGVDYEIELVDQEVVSGNRIWIQLKSVEKVKLRTARYKVADKFPDLKSDGKGNICAEYVSFSLSMKEIEYSQRCHFPLLLILVDLSDREAYWVPIRDEVNHNLDLPELHRKKRKSATLRIPRWNSLSAESKRGFSGLRWFALEPGRMYAFSILHHFYHEFQHVGRLSGYSIGDGHIDNGEKDELIRSLLTAREMCMSALSLDVLFGEQGVDYFKTDTIAVLEAPGIALQIAAGAKAATDALGAIRKNAYSFKSLALQLGVVSQAINLMSTAISSYQGFRGRYLLKEDTAVWNAWLELEGKEYAPPPFPTSRQPSWGSRGMN